MAVPDSETSNAAQRVGPPVPVFWAGVAIALVHLAFALVRPSPAAVELAGFELVVFAGLVTVELIDSNNTLGSFLAVTGLFVVFVGGTWLSLDRLAVRWAVVVLAVLAASCAYGLYRYQLVALGLVEGNNEQ